MTQNGRTDKEAKIQKGFIQGIGPGAALYQMTRAEIKILPDKIVIKNLNRMFNEYILPKRKIYQNRGEFFWPRQNETGKSEDF